MNKLLYTSAFVLTILVCYACASVGVITGGEKDIIKPLLVGSKPTNLTTNFTDKKITLTFSEPIQASDLKNQLIISPSIDRNKYNYTIKKNTLTLNFDEPLEENTTYTLNLRESIKDLTEGNISEKLDFAFSTGEKIDSLSISGKVFNILTGEPIENATVALYNAADTLTIFNSPPRYFTQTNKLGAYQLDYLREGSYAIYAFEDKNKNLKTEPAEEAYGFVADTIRLIKPIADLHISLQKLNISPLRILSNRADGRYYVITFNKPITSYELQSADTSQNLYSNLYESNTKIRIYPYAIKADSLSVTILASDTINQSIEQKTFVKFKPSAAKKEAFQVTILPGDKASIEEDYKATFKFNKPVIQVIYDSLYFRYDSINTISITPEDLRWNAQQDMATILKKVPKPSEASGVSMGTLEGRNISGSKQALPQRVTLYMGSAAFISLEQDSSNQQTKTYSYKNPEDFGVIKGKVDTDLNAFIIQLIDKSGKVVAEKKNQKNYQFTNIKPGEYRMRIISDLNNNGQWDPGNVKLRIPPEPVMFYPDALLLRANWELIDQNIVL